MAQRVFLSGNPPRLITSKPGQNASPSLADDQKTFDSDWFYGGGIKFHLTANSLNTSSVNFPIALNYIPSVVGIKVMDMDKEPAKTLRIESGVPSPPANAKSIILSGGVEGASRANIGTSSIYNIPLQTNIYYNYITHFFVFEA
jgi:hypothetical protein